MRSWTILETYPPILINVEGPFEHEKITELSKGFSVSYENIVTFIYDQGMFIRQAFDSLSDEVHKKVCCLIEAVEIFVIDFI